MDFFKTLITQSPDIIYNFSSKCDGVDGFGQIQPCFNSHLYTYSFDFHVHVIYDYYSVWKMRT